MKISTDICNFYRNSIAPLQTQGSFKKISPISRLEFNAGAVFAICFLCAKIAQSIFLLAGSVLTLGLHKKMRISLLKNAKKSLVYAGAIPLGIVGVFFPKVINQAVLKIPPQGLITPLNP